MIFLVINMDYDRKSVGDRIAHRRKSLHIKQNILAERLEISNNHLSAIETGKVSPSFDLFLSICKELNVTPDYLILGAMRSKNIPKSIEEGLRLCSQDDLSLIYAIVQFCVKRNK